MRNHKIALWFSFYGDVCRKAVADDNERLRGMDQLFAVIPPATQVDMLSLYQESNIEAVTEKLAKRAKVGGMYGHY